MAERYNHKSKLLTCLTRLPPSPETLFGILTPFKRTTRAEGQFQIACSVLNRGGYVCPGEGIA